MDNNTSIKVPKSKQHMINALVHDEDGWWIYMNDGFYVEYEGQHIMSFDTRKQLEKYLKRTGVCTCEECEKALRKKVEQEVKE